jgi:hypothetical protein
MEHENRLNVDKLMSTLSEILSEKYGCKITMRAVPKDSEEGREILRQRQEQEALRKAEEAKAG